MGNLCRSPRTRTVPPELQPEAPRRGKEPLSALAQIPTSGYPPAPPPDAPPLSVAARLGTVAGAVADRGFRADVARGLVDVANRGAAAVLGGPVDLASAALRPLGYQHPAPVGGSEWIGQGMEAAGMVTPERRPAAEAMAALAVPGTLTAGARGLSRVADMGPVVVPSAGQIGSRSTAAAQLGVISPEGKARLLADLQAGKGSGTYRLGDVTQGQAAGLDALFGRPGASRDVFMTDKAVEHIIERRMGDRGYSPEDVTRFVEAALQRRARPELDVSKSGQNPALRNTNVADPVTGRRHDAFMPFKQGEDGYEVRTVYAPGLPPRNEKTPKR